MQDFEKLGVFYLGKEYDLKGKALQENLLLYDSRDLVTHAVVVGMTGSGKTGLCIGMIEEAAIDGVPSILIDPKGDLANLLLTFPQLRPQDFQPWVNAEDAARKNQSVEEYAAAQAAQWEKGIADWGQDGARIQRLRDSAEFVIYTPGSNAGVQVSILKSFAAPPPEILEDGELLQERVSTTVTSLLGLLNIEADPLQSREHILLSTLLAHTWRNGQDLDLASLITQIQTPPITKIGVLDLENFYPTKERFSLVMALNNLLASPGFQSWLQGQALDIGQLLYTSQGKPRVAIFSIAHLGDSERMFFVSLLLNQVLGWVRTQPGTTSLRALLYMDEIFGYFPPIANPPSKQPLLTLLKQARAFGLGVVLATQNPVDLDYKGLGNTGTWFIGRLQTERDKQRVMEGLEGAAVSSGGSFNRQQMEALLAGLGSRVFLMNNTHDDEPAVFSTRWCLSYLRGPLTRSQIKTLMDPYKAQTSKVSETFEVSSNGAAVPTTAASEAVAAPSTASLRPSLPPEVTEYFIPARGSQPAYRAMLLGSAKVRYFDKKAGLDAAQDIHALAPITDSVVPVDWTKAQNLGLDPRDLERTPVSGARFADLPRPAAIAKNYTGWRKDFTDWVYGAMQITLLRSPSTGGVSRAGEDERDFRIRLQQAAREHRDEAMEALRKKYAAKIATAEEKVRKAEQAVEREKEQARQAGMQTAVSVGTSLLGALMGRKKLSKTNLNKVGTAARGVGRSVQQQGDVNRAKESVEVYAGQLQALNAEFEKDTEALVNRIDPLSEQLEKAVFKPTKSNIDVQLVALIWAPYTSEGERAW